MDAPATLIRSSAAGSGSWPLAAAPAALAGVLLVASLVDSALPTAPLLAATLAGAWPPSLAVPEGLAEFAVPAVRAVSAVLAAPLTAPALSLPSRHMTN